MRTYVCYCSAVYALKWDFAAFCEGVRGCCEKEEGVGREESHIDVDERVLRR